MRFAEKAELVNAQEHVLRRCRLQRGHELAIAGHVDHRHFEHGQAFEGLSAHLHVAEDHYLSNGGDRHTLEFLAVFADDQVLAAFADVRARFLQVKNSPIVARGQDARDAIAFVCRIGLV